MVVACVVLVVVAGSIISAVMDTSDPWEPFKGYYRDSAPDGWYHQRQSISQYNLQNNGTEVFFAMCDHSYLGPLHGTFKVASGVSFGDGGRFDLRLKGNVIVEAVPYT